MNKQCPQCGKVYADEFVFCAEDGTDLVAHPADSAQAINDGSLRVVEDSSTGPSAISSATSLPASPSLSASTFHGLSLPALAGGGVLVLLLGAGIFLAANRHRVVDKESVPQSAPKELHDTTAAKTKRDTASTALQPRKAVPRPQNTEAPNAAETLRPPSTPQTSEAMREYNDSQLDASFRYPAGWTKSVQEYPGGRTRVRFDAPSPHVYFLLDISPRQAGLDSPGAVWRDMNRRYAKAYKGRYRLISLTDKALDGRPASRWEFVLQKSKEPALHKIDWSVFEGTRHYALLFAAPPAQWEAYYKTWSHVLLSFKFSTDND